MTVSLLACVVAEPSFGPYAPYGGFYGIRPYFLDGAPGIHPGGGVSYTARSPQGIGKRSADPEPSFGPYAPYGGFYGLRPYLLDGAPAIHPGGAVSYTARSPQGIGKRSADAEPGYGYGPVYGGYYGGFYGNPYGYYGATSYEYRSPQGLRGKREAEPSFGQSFQHVARAQPYGGISEYGVATGGFYGASLYDRRRTPLIHKREAEPSFSFQNVNRYLGYGGASSYAVTNNGYLGVVDERRVAPFNNYAYGFGAF